ncbi:MAG: class I SAM-dependent methyltransferase, partial [Gaiellaceae bacterium]
AVGEVGATLGAALVVMGDRLGLYRAMAGAGPLTPSELAERTQTAERYVREWLGAQAAGGYVDYDPQSGRYELPPEQAVALTDEDSPAYLPGFFQIALGSVLDSPRITEAAKSGDGIGWHDHVHDVHEGCERFFRPSYNAHLLTEWLPALDGIVEKLEAGGTVADVGCGHGASTILMAEAFPASRFHGFDYHEGSIATAAERAKAAGVEDRAVFSKAPAASYSGDGYDLVTMFDCLHDMGDPAGAARHVRASLAPGGSWMIVEPRAGDRVEENLNPVGRAYYGFSTFLCTPSSLSQEVGLALGAQAGEARIREIVLGAGFTSFRRVAETPFNMVFEARP